MSRESRQDLDLAELFAAQAKDESELAPEFELLIRRPQGQRARPPAWRLGLAMAAALLLVTSLWLVLRPISMSPANADLALSTELDPSWSAPSDFLLQSPIESSLDSEPDWSTDFLESLDPADFLEDEPQTTHRRRRTLS